MTGAAKLAAFAGGLAALSGGDRVAVALVDADVAQPVVSAHDDVAGVSHPPSGGRENAPSPPRQTESVGAHGGTHKTEQAAPVRGLAVAQDGLQIVMENPELRRDRTQMLRYRVVDDGEETVRGFDVEHDKRMHLIVVRRDLTGFQHLHPRQQPDGSWAAALRIDGAGSYRVFADFAHDGEPYTLASDVRVDSEADLKSLPAPTNLAVSDGGYDVRFQASGGVGAKAELRYTITRDGEPVHTQAYLGAGGRLVALREGDLGFLHVHPTEPGQHKTTTGSDHGKTVSFAATFPTRGRYRLFLQFQHQRRLHTVAFTHEAAAP